MPLKFVNFSNFSHILRAYISKRKRCFDVKSSTNYFHMTMKILADFQICISVPLRFFRVLTHIFFCMRHFRLQIFQPCYGTQRNHILDETDTKTILWKTLLNAHAFFVKPLITNRTSSHKFINTIFRIAHKKVLSAYTKNINVSLKKSATWNPLWNLWKRW